MNAIKLFLISLFTVNHEDDNADRDRGQVVPGAIWWVVGVLAAIALIIFIIKNVNVN